MPKEEPSKIYYIKLFFGALEETFQFKRLARYWLPVWAWGFLIFYLSSKPTIDTGPYKLDTLWHLTTFGILALLILRAFRSYGFSWSDAYILSAFISFTYAISDEIHQIFVPKRSFSILDLILDLIGIAVLGLVIRIFLKKKK